MCSRRNCRRRDFYSIPCSMWWLSWPSSSWTGTTRALFSWIFRRLRYQQGYQVHPLEIYPSESGAVECVSTVRPPPSIILPRSLILTLWLVWHRRQIPQVFGWCLLPSKRRYCKTHWRTQGFYDPCVSPVPCLFSFMSLSDFVWSSSLSFTWWVESTPLFRLLVFLHVCMLFSRQMPLNPCFVHCDLSSIRFNHFWSSHLWPPFYLTFFTLFRWFFYVLSWWFAN